MNILMADKNLSFLLLLDLSEHFINSVRVLDVTDLNPSLEHLRQKEVLADITQIELHMLLKELLKWWSDDL
jgi:hypothetical protein